MLKDWNRFYLPAQIKSLGMRSDLGSQGLNSFFFFCTFSKTFEGIRIYIHPFLTLHMLNQSYIIQSSSIQQQKQSFTHIIKAQIPTYLEVTMISHENKIISQLHNISLLILWLIMLPLCVTLQFDWSQLQYIDTLHGDFQSGTVTALKTQFGETCDYS